MKRRSFAARKRILLGFSSASDAGLVTEIISQLDRRISIPPIPNDSYLLDLLSVKTAGSVSTLVVFSGFAAQIEPVVRFIRQNEAWSGIPLIVFLSSGDTPTVVERIEICGTVCYRKPEKPSEWKQMLRLILRLYGLNEFDAQADQTDRKQ